MLKVEGTSAMTTDSVDYNIVVINKGQRDLMTFTSVSAFNVWKHHLVPEMGTSVLVEGTTIVEARSYFRPVPADQRLQTAIRLAQQMIQSLGLRGFQAREVMNGFIGRAATVCQFEGTESDFNEAIARHQKISF
ncbi:hypothetical protein C5B42_02520 [Candidatus Cerribacteria bacterium 'Amazon FNV 2010 28 9']|uniref:Uncharacterized protein n=1 Tax=Candidatus Cerribacteria bacterium 'Amazon FNV 2010 28 9' TaxID=2081795 RepID=A0A317JPF9_9BACT|nr:MAG: hypothetical protein C5B42_02520 [Candidatus Cerribacteria bacterium 'Amazon FNV 2010 28 9']